MLRAIARGLSALLVSPRLWASVLVALILFLGEEEGHRHTGQVPEKYLGTLGVHSLANFTRSKAAEQRSTASALGWIGEPASVDYLVAILSARKNFERREDIRAVWSDKLRRQAKARGMSIEVVFIVGSKGGAGSFGEADTDRLAASATSVASLSEEELDAHLMREHLHNDDLFCVEVLDTYNNSASKMARFYHTLFTIGLQYRGLIKMDDDTVLFPTRLLDVLDVKTSTCWASALPEGATHCSSSADGGVVPSVASVLATAEEEGNAMLWWGNFRTSEKVGRSADLKWKVSHSAYRRNFFPTYASGPMHVLSYSLSYWLGAHYAELDISSVWMEDVAHALWFDQAVASAASTAKLSHKGRPARVCRVFDYRFAGMPQYCSDQAFGVGSLEPHQAGLALCQRAVTSRITGRSIFGRSGGWSASLFPYYYLEHQQGVTPDKLALVKYWPIEVCGSSDTLLAASPQSWMLTVEQEQAELSALEQQHSEEAEEAEEEVVEEEEGSRGTAATLERPGLTVG